MNNKGMLATTAPGRPSFLRYLVDLYRADAAFRGFVDFAVIGGVVLGFLHFLPSKDASQPSGQQATTHSTPNANEATRNSPVASTPDKTATPDKAATPNKSAAPEVAKVAIPFPKFVTSPALRAAALYDIDEAMFRSSAAADQPRLSGALRALHRQQFGEIAGLLAEADAKDPNVAFMRGIGLAASGKEDDLKAAAEVWRAAAEGGNRKAALHLARLQVVGPHGIAKDVAQGRKVIEDAAAAGDREAQSMAAIAYLSGQFSINPTKARDYFRQAAQAGDAGAMLFYSFTLGWAIGGPADQAGAEDFLRRSAVGGVTFAQQALGEYLLEKYKKKLIDDPREAVEWLQKAVRTGYDYWALRDLAFFYGAQKEPPWNDKSKIYELAQLCSGLKDPWCQAENGWVFQYGIGTKPDLVRAFAHYQVAIELGHTQSTKSIEGPSQKLSAADKLKAIELAKKFGASLKPIPDVWGIQYGEVSPPPSRWNILELPAAPEAVHTASLPPGTTCTRVAFRQIADLCNNCSAPPYDGELKRTSAEEWTASFIDGHKQPGTSQWRMTLQTKSEILLYDASRDRYARIDLGQNKGFTRAGAAGSWVATSEVRETNCR